MYLFKLAQVLISKRFVPEMPTELKGKDVAYVFDKSSRFELTYDE